MTQTNQQASNEAPERTAYLEHAKSCPGCAGVERREPDAMRCGQGMALALSAVIERQRAKARP